MPTHLARRTAVLTVAAATALTGTALTGTLAGAQPGQRTHTTLSIRVSDRAINPGGGSFVSGRFQSLRHHTANRRIVLMAHPQDSTGWTKVARHRTHRHGQVRFQVVPDTTTAYQLRFPGNKRQQPTRSGVVRVRVLDTTSLTISVAQRSVDPGQTDTVNGVLSLDGNPLAGDDVQLRQVARHHRHGRIVATQTTGEDGSVNFPVTPAATAHYQLVFRRTAANAHARSAIATVRVRTASSLSIRARQSKDGSHELVGGQLRGGGHGLANRKVTLQERASGTNDWNTVMRHRTKRHGNVRFAVGAPSHNEDYRLVFAGGAAYQPCESGVVTVTVA